MLEVAEFAIRAPEIPQGRSPRRDRLGEDGPDRLDQPADPEGGDPAGRAAGRDARPVQGFGGVDIAHSGDQALVQKQGFHRSPPAGKTRPEPGRVEIRPERLGAEAAEQPVGVPLRGRHQIHHPEAAGIAEHHPCGRRPPAGTGFQIQHDMVMRAGAGIGGVGIQDQEPAGHAEMGEKGVAAIEGGEQIFAAPLQALDALPGQASGETGRQGPAQIRPAGGGLRDPPLFEQGGESPADGLDFGEFRHGRRHGGGTGGMVAWCRGE